MMMSDDFEIRNAIIKSAKIDMGDKNLLTAWLDLGYGSTGQSFGGHALYLPKSYTHHELKSYAGHFLFRCMEIAGVEKWDDIVGKSVRVKRNCQGVKAIGHIIKDDWFYPAKDFNSQNKGNDDE